jgi:(+)-trans-carveol dehydrogenase
VAFVTGAARGQGREHAVYLAREGAAVIATDICGDMDVVEYPLGTRAELEETAALVEAEGGRIVVQKADVRSSEELDEAVARGLAEFGGIDIVCANAGVILYGRAWELTERQWLDVLDVNLSGVWRTAKAVAPSMIERGRGGSIIITSSSVAHQVPENMGPYAAAKTGLSGLSRTLARELGHHNIRVNTLHPTAVKTVLYDNDATAKVFDPGRTFASDQERLQLLDDSMMGAQLLPVSSIEPKDLSNAVLFLASDESRYMTGSELRVDAGYPNV